jgi:para-aminobenzoate synthetase component I
MKPVICFFKEQQFLYSENYKLLSCADNESVTDFLNKVHLESQGLYKIVQINFEFDNAELFQSQETLYKHPKASAFILKTHQIVSEAELLNTLTDSSENLKFEILEERQDFCRKVNKIKTDISSGRIYQVNLTAALKAKSNSDSLSLFKKYFYQFNGNYKAFLPIQENDILCFSPELFLQKTGISLITQPIKGSASPEQNFERHLLENRKEEAELSMIVDLLRNDLNRINSDHNSYDSAARVTKHRAPMQLGYIQHTYSEIELNTSKNISDILACTMPGGSISGCPKIESLQVICENEKYKRQVYTGCIGWWHDNDFVLNLSIRTFIKTSENLFYHAGCGIVYDSVAEHEWNEFLLKTAKIGQA